MQNAEKVIRVAQVIGMAIDGGVEACIMNYYRHIDRTKVQFDFFVESTSKIIDKDEIEAMGGRVVIIPHYSHPFTYLRVLERLFREGHYDIVHSNMNTLSVFPLLAAKRAGIPVRISHNHSTWGRHEPLRNLMKFFLRPTAKWFATEYAACSLRAAEWMYGKRKVKAGKVTVFNNAVDPSRFSFRPETRVRIREENGWEEDFIVGHIGRFMKQKNHEFLVKIFAEVVKREPRARLVLVGDGELRPKVTRQVEKLGLSARVSFVGAVTNPEDYYMAFDAFVLPSRYEGLPVVGVEAQTAGLPCFFSDKVTREVLLTPHAKMLPLDSPTHWAEEICAGAPVSDRGDDAVNISAFDIREQGKQMTAFYKMILD
ncbi:MAG: glycosyltransferase family 1 protein [Eubacteriales bacterium]